MKATDLTIADYVYFNCFDGSKIIVKITAINNDGIVYGVSEYGSHWCNIDKVEPIPITKEIFEKNGFKLNPQGAYSNGRHTSIGVIRDGRYFANINTETDDASFLYQCGKYVHEFQHALRICGLNELADNLKME